MSGRLCCVGAPGVAAASPPPHPSASSTVIILLGLLSLITCDFGVLCLCLPLVPPDLVLMERADSGQYLPACRYLNEGGM